MMHQPFLLLTLIICQTLLPQIPHPQATQAQHNPPQDALIDVLLGPARTPFTIDKLPNISRRWIRPTQENYTGTPVLQSRSGTKPAAARWLECILFGKEDYFIRGDVAKVPPEGWRIMVLDRDKDDEDFDGTYSDDEYDTNES